MNNLELDAVRRVLFLSVQDMADAFDVRDRSVNRWIKGQHPVPDFVVEKLNDMLVWREAAIDEMVVLIGSKSSDVIELTLKSRDDWVSEDEPSEMYKPYLSVIAEIYTTHDHARIKSLDAS